MDALIQTAHTRLSERVDHIVGKSVVSKMRESCQVGEAMRRKSYVAFTE